MNSLFFKAIIVAIIGLGLLSPQVSEAGQGGSKTVNMSYAGSGFDTQFDSNGDGLYVSLSQTTGKGSLGKSTIEISAEFGPLGAYDCFPPNTPAVVGFPLVSSEAIYTFADQSQLFAVSSGGYLCLNTDGGNYWGQVEGEFVGGTGRYGGATGTYTSPFQGQNLGNPDFGGFRSITGTVEGTVFKGK
jgi:hypothetical protein